jgi:hypothetical protein
MLVLNQEEQPQSHGMQLTRADNGLLHGGCMQDTKWISKHPDMFRRAYLEAIAYQERPSWPQQRAGQCGMQGPAFCLVLWAAVEGKQEEWQVQTLVSEVVPWTAKYKQGSCSSGLEDQDQGDPEFRQAAVSGRV